jgi:hypothetical protein
MVLLKPGEGAGCGFDDEPSSWRGELGKSQDTTWLT